MTYAERHIVITCKTHGPYTMVFAGMACPDCRRERLAAESAGSHGICFTCGKEHHKIRMVISMDAQGRHILTCNGCWSKFSLEQRHRLDAGYRLLVPVGTKPCKR